MTLQEYMTGKSLAFKSMTMRDKHTILLQIAEILEALQKNQLPSTVENMAASGSMNMDSLLVPP